MALPIGLSFHTFQAMSYTIEVYRKNHKPERNFCTYALYVMFFPQLVAGPIERPQNILYQLKEFRPYNRDNVKEGISRMLWGFLKKCVIADRLAIAVDMIFAHYWNSSSVTLLIGAFLYSFQIYCDFSGYSDIAIGAAKVLNINLVENFKQPYLSSNISEFWRRWHISLSSWFRDYLYIPLGGSRRSKPRVILNIMIVFLISGLWHGANTTFIVWGFLHGCLFIIYMYLPYFKVGRVISVIFNFTLVTFLWIFFRAEDIRVAFYYICNIFKFQSGSNDIGLSIPEFIFSILLIFIFLLREKYIPGHLIKNNKVHYLYVFSMILICYFFGVFLENQFIYFQF